MSGSASQSMAALSGAAAEASGISWWAASDADLLEQAIVLERVTRQVAATHLALVAEIHARNAAVTAGARSTASWLVAKTGVPRGAANRVVQTATRMAHHAPAVRDALGSGAISLGHAAVIAAVLNELGVRAQRVDSPVTWEVRATAQATMLQIAATLDPAQLAVAGEVLIQRVDPDPDYTGDDGMRQDAARRSLVLSRDGDGGGLLRGSLDPESFAVLQAALSPLAAPRPRTAEGPDQRSAAQRNADALVDLAQRALAAGDLPGEGGGTGATVFVHCDHDQLQGALTDASATLETGTTIPVESLRRLACDAHVIAAVLGSSSQPLDIGRATRTVPLGIRRALTARDKHCAFPGCDVPPAWCHAHHIRFWADGGPPALPTLVLLGGHPHRLIHHTPWAVTITDDGLPTFTPPPWLNTHITTADPTWRVLLNERFPRQPRAG